MDDLPYHYRSPVMLIDSNPHGFNPWVQSPMLLVRSPQKHDEAPSNPDPPNLPPGDPPRAPEPTSGLETIAWCETKQCLSFVVTNQKKDVPRCFYQKIDFS